MEIENVDQLLKISAKDQKRETGERPVLYRFRRENGTSEEKADHKNSPTTSSRSFLTVGSPPVNLILLTPCSTKILATLSTSSALNKLLFGVRGTPSSGMQ